MKTVNVEIALGNEQMQRVTDVAKALRWVADRLEWGNDLDVRFQIKDDNGNTVGTFWADQV